MGVTTPPLELARPVVGSMYWKVEAAVLTAVTMKTPL